MKKKAKTHRIKRIIFGIVATVILIVWVLVQRAPIQPARAWGVTFSYPYMEQFGIPWREAYEAMLSDLGVRKLRIPVYWPEVAHTATIYNFDNYDYQIEKATQYNAKLILAVGRKLPRWPECHEAPWANTMTEAEKQYHILRYIAEVINRYKSSPALEAWQVENEPFLSFGVCPPLDVNFLDKEIALVRSLDPSHPIVVTDSGELSIWIYAARRADIFGTTMYRTIYKNNIGYFTYPLPPSFFRLKRALTELATGKRPMIVIELQGESWGPRLIYEMDKTEQYKSFNPQKFKETIEYAKRTGFDTFYLWGVEWWYWLKEKQGRPEMWNIARELFVNK
jgi:hypothetical protein